ncbi:hypothetical protein G9A89_023130 [Geosiphon pyriformis]|nr:hypothetical protein G9A89_023130 [Geosiphon pyriformis]
MCRSSGSYEQNMKLQKKRKFVEAEDNIEYLQMGNKSLHVVHKSQVSLLTASGKRQAGEERLEEDIFEENPFLTKNSPSSPSPVLQSPPFQDNEADTVTEITSFDCPIIINDVEELQLEPLPRQGSRWVINKIDTSEKWYQFKEKSLKLAMTKGLFVKSHVPQIFLHQLLSDCSRARLQEILQ